MPGSDIDFSKLEYLTPEEDSLIASARDTSFQLSQLILPNGMTYKQYLLEHDSTRISSWGQRTMQAKTDQFNEFIIATGNPATYMTNRDNPAFDFPAGDGTNKPAHKGIAYVYDTKNTENSYETRFKSGDCDLYLHGLDCSGFVCRVLKSAGLNLGSRSHYAVSELTIDKLNDCFKNTPQYSDLSYEDIGQVATSEISAGDLMVFLKKDLTTRFHIGIVCEAADKSVYIYQSNGTPVNSANNGCSNNTSVKRGARCVVIADFVSNEPWKRYKVFRLKSKSNQLLKNGGDNQTGSPNQVLSQPIEIKINNYKNEPVKDVKIKWETQNGSVSSVESLTDNNGLARVQWTLGDATGQKLLARAFDENEKEIDGSPVTFIAQTKSGSCALSFYWGLPRGFTGVKFSGPYLTQSMGIIRDCNNISTGSPGWSGVGLILQPGESLTLTAVVSNIPVCGARIQDSTKTATLSCPK